jgi:hypothetical protein
MSNRFKPFNNDELAMLGTGLALAGGIAGIREEVTPMLGEVNEELARRTNK